MNETSFLNIFSKRLKMYLSREEMSQKELAEKLAFTRFVAQRERNQERNLLFDTTNKISPGFPRLLFTFLLSVSESALTLSCGALFSFRPTFLFAPE